MKRLLVGAAIAAMICSAMAAQAAYNVTFDFETGWTTDYAPGWENTAYRHGEAPVGKMMEQVGGGYGSGNAMKLIADSTPESWMWWAAVNPTDIDYGAMAKQYDPYVSAWYYDEGWETGSLHAAGQIFAVPSWVNPYIDGSEDWTDIQFGARMNQIPPADNYYYVAAGEASPGWQDTAVDRANGWVNLKMQLSSADGRVHFFVNGVDKGSSYRNDYVDLGDVGLYTMFTDPLSGWGDNKPYTIWDNVEFGSSAPIPEPVFFQFGALMGLSGLGVLKLRRR